MSKGEVIVLGCGLIGTSIAIDFLGSSSVSSVTVVDVSNERLSSLQQRASKFSGIDPVSGSNAKLTEKLHTVELDVIRHREELLKLLEKADSRNRSSSIWNCGRICAGRPGSRHQFC